MKREWLIKRRIELGLTQSQVAMKIGIHRTTYGQFETGIRNPSVATAKKIAELFGFDWTIFFAQNRCETHLKITGTSGG